MDRLSEQRLVPTERQRTLVLNTIIQCSSSTALISDTSCTSLCERWFSLLCTTSTNHRASIDHFSNDSRFSLSPLHRRIPFPNGDFPCLHTQIIVQVPKGSFALINGSVKMSIQAGMVRYQIRSEDKGARQKESSIEISSLAGRKRIASTGEP